MATEVAPTSQARVMQTEDENAMLSEMEAPKVNGDRVNITQPATGDDPSNHDDFIQNGSLPMSETTVNMKDAAAAPDSNPDGPTPIDDVTEGIQPVSSFVPKEAPNLSHPTPPPEQTLLTDEANIDTAMTDADAPGKPESESEWVMVSSEQSLVRHREDDDDEEPVAKRSKVEEGARADTILPEVPLASTMNGDVAVESVAQPDVKPTLPAEEADIEPKLPQVDAPMAEPAKATEKANELNAPVAESSATELPADATAQPSIETEPAPPTQGVPATADKPKYDTASMTSTQKTFLLEKMKNLKKTKNSPSFLKPVDYVALNIPSYPEIIKHPMDLSTMDAKLKDDRYGSVSAFTDDFDLIVGNCRRFNGDAHPVSQSAMNMEAYFRKIMEQCPSADAPPPQPKKRSPSVPKAQPRRESRAAAAAAASPAGGETFALQPDGTPQIRRDSTMNRPARAIKPPANRELTYAKPKRKEHILELRFCEHVLEELRSPKYAQTNQVFMFPVDPVALNIPHYRQIVKHPMDLSTMGQKLKQGQYGKASEFKKDFDLIINNCLAFNPQGNPVRDLGILFQRQLQELWNGKEKWEKQHKPESQRGTSASGDEEDDDDDDEEDEPEDEKEQTIRALQKQLADMQNSLASALGGGNKAPKQKKPKTKTGPSKKLGSLSSQPPKAKSAPAKRAVPKKERLVTYDEKQEISEAVGRMNDHQVSDLTSIITKNCPKYAENEDMELEIDDLPNNVQLMLLKFVRDIFGRPKKAPRSDSPDDAAAVDDDDFEPERGPRGGSKRKKHKPMNKREQEDKIQTLKSKLNQFNATSGSESPTSSFNVPNAQADTSGDEESEESEEE